MIKKVCIVCNIEKELRLHMDVCDECVDDRAEDADLQKMKKNIEKFENSNGKTANS